MPEEVMKKLLEQIKINESTAELCSIIVEDLKNGTETFLQLTENLESLLTNPDITIRRAGSETLSIILQKLPEEYLSSREIEFIVKFYCDRLLDHHSIIPAVLKGFLSMLKMKNLPHGMVSKIFSTMNLHFVSQSQPQPDRLLSYEIFVTMMHKSPTELQAIGPDFVCGYLTAIDSERDPRNLLYLFTSLPYFYNNFPPGHLLEDAFEAASCYFPIDFRANPNDPRGVSREQLSDTLLPCLTAIPEFTSLTVALALEKLSSDLLVAKLDSLELLKKCFEKFPSDKMVSHVDEIMTALLNELKPGYTNEEIKEKLVKVLLSSIKHLHVDGQNEAVTKILHTIYNSVQYYLNDIRLNLFQDGVKLLYQVSFASEAASRFIAIKTLPKLLNIIPSSKTDTTNLLHSVQHILKSCVYFEINCAAIDELTHIWNQIPELFLRNSESETTEIKMLAIDGCTSVIQLLSVQERKKFYSILCHNIKFASEDNSNKSMKCLKSIAVIYPEEIHSAIVSEFENDESCQHRKKIFQCYCILATVPDFLIYVDKEVKNYIRHDSFEYATYMIECLKNMVVTEKNNKSFLNLLHYNPNITKYLMDWWHTGCKVLVDDINNVFEDEQIATNLLLIISIIIRQLDVKSQQDIATYYFQLTLDYSERFMNSFEYLNSNEDSSTPTVHCSLSIITFEGIVDGSLPEVLEETFSRCLTQIIKYLVALSIYCSRPLCCLVACKSIASIFNKIKEGPNLESQMKYVFSYICTILSEKSDSLKVNAVNLLIYVIKALLLRGYVAMDSWCDQLLELIKRDCLGTVVTEGFQLIIKEDDYHLSSSCHCTVKLFYRQRLFSYCIPKLVEQFQDSDTNTRKRCAVSALYLLDGVPRAIVAKHFKQIVPLVIELLQINDSTSLANVAVKKFIDILDHDPVLFEEYVETFISRLLLLAREDPNLNVRISALECLHSYTKLNLAIILPFKTKVLQELSCCLDDKKRLVRKSAVKTRTRWFVIGT